MKKDYKKWMEEKSKINNTNSMPVGFHVREIWWCSIGENVGVEIDGKGEKYLRPVLIIKKFGQNAFLGLPFTSKPHKIKKFYYPYNLSGKQDLIIFSQIRAMDTNRLFRKIETMPKSTFNDMFQKMFQYFQEKMQDHANGPDSPKA